MITGINEAHILRESVNSGQKRLTINQVFGFHITSFWELMNMDKLDILK